MIYARIKRAQNLLAEVEESQSSQVTDDDIDFLLAVADIPPSQSQTSHHPQQQEQHQQEVKSLNSTFDPSFHTTSILPLQRHTPQQLQQSRGQQQQQKQQQEIKTPKPTQTGKRKLPTSNSDTTDSQVFNI